MLAAVDKSDGVVMNDDETGWASSTSGLQSSERIVKEFWELSK